MNNIQERIEQVIVDNSLIIPGDKVVLAVSGGPDSMALLYILNSLKSRLNFDFVVAHVNHKIREESEFEKEYVKSYCNKIGVEFYYLEKDVITEAQMNKMGIEEYARKIRYDFFYKLKEELKYNKIAIAHNLNDKIETILFNLIRGCSLKGLTGMQYAMQDIIRPMLDIPKKDILEFCESIKINPCIDKTNFENIYTRNKIRLDLIPFIEQNFNPNFLESIDRMSKLIADDDEFIEEYTENIFKNSIVSMENDNIIFNYENILKQKKSIQTRTIRKIINNLLKNVQGIEKKHVLDIIKLLENNITNKMYIIGNKFSIKIIKKNIARISINY